MYLCVACQSSTLKKDPGKLETLQVVDFCWQIVVFDYLERF